MAVINIVSAVAVDDNDGVSDGCGHRGGGKGSGTASGDDGCW